jgi:hypothetical protein
MPELPPLPRAKLHRVAITNIPTSELREQLIAITEELSRRLPGASPDRQYLEGQVLPQMRYNDTYLRAHAQEIVDAAKKHGIIPRDWYSP